ncbi:unnamed protein product [Caenorhabditis auriculariae]|uniref:Uncharacterized protein n=1 Tax=Caenorhabditis auriculariae TaxID=2777116 RepID=A0A8S1HTV2_9PELO|nr:unnamed protein product [Caenorhabditis auriculariae]
MMQKPMKKEIGIVMTAARRCRQTVAKGRGLYLDNPAAKQYKQWFRAHDSNSRNNSNWVAEKAKEQHLVASTTIFSLFFVSFHLNRSIAEAVGGRSEAEYSQ